MSEGLDVFIVDDDAGICEILKETVEGFYTWGDVHAFTDVEEAIDFCRNCGSSMGIFILDVFVGANNGFYFLDAVEEFFPSVYNDAIMITGMASEDVVNMCVASEVHYLLEKPVKKYALQLAVRSIASKYLNFAKRILMDPEFAETIKSM